MILFFALSLNSDVAGLPGSPEFSRVLALVGTPLTPLGRLNPCEALHWVGPVGTPRNGKPGPTVLHFMKHATGAPHKAVTEIGT